MNPTAMQLQSLVVSEVGRILLAAGLYAPREDGVIPPVMRGLAIGAKAVGLLTEDPLAVSDAELAVLSPFAIDWVKDVAVHHVLGLVLHFNWYRVVQTHLKAVEPQPLAGGWLAEQKAGIRAEYDRLGAILAGGFRETTDPVLVNPHGPSVGYWYGPWGHPDFAWPCPADWPACLPYRDWC